MVSTNQIISAEFTVTRLRVAQAKAIGSLVIGLAGLALSVSAAFTIVIGQASVSLAVTIVPIALSVFICMSAFERLARISG